MEDKKIFIGLAAVAALGAAYYFFMKPKKAKTVVAVPSSTSATATVPVSDYPQSTLSTSIIYAPPVNNTTPLYSTDMVYQGNSGQLEVYVNKSNNQLYYLDIPSDTWIDVNSNRVLVNTGVKSFAGE
jgi:hypothetical protein